MRQPGVAVAAKLNELHLTKGINCQMTLTQMIEDNTPTVTARRRKPTELMRIRLENARRLQGVNAKTKEKRAASKAKRDKETRKAVQEAGSHAFEIAPRVPKVKKNRLSQPPRPESKFQKRQRSKTWLPTHVFHAKRAHMAPSHDPLWRFALPISPTEKSYRPSHRARGMRGAVVWDASYMSTVQLEGTEPALEAVLRAVGIDGDEAWGVRGRKWRSGTRSLESWAFEKTQDGVKRPIGPVTVIWQACSRTEDTEMVDANNTNARQKKAKKDRRRLFVRVHPSAFLQLWNDILFFSKRQNPPVMVEDLRFEIGSIEITGPGSTEALLAALHPVLDDDQGSGQAESPEATWNSLLGVTNPSSLPQNALLAFSVTDPRLHYPPTRLTVPSDDNELMNNLAILLSSWPPDKTQSPAALFDRPSRLVAARNLPSQKAVNRRRSLAGPGQYPPPQPKDPKIPVIMYASRPGHGLAKSNGSSIESSNLPGTWTVLLPWKCVLAIWYSLLYYPLSSGSNPRFGGVKEQQQLAFEAGEPWFPGDFPGTRAGWEWNLRERSEAKSNWERRPKGRRIEFESLDLGNSQKGEIGLGWACDWERLVLGRQAIGTSVQESQRRNGKGRTKEKKEGPVTGVDSNNNRNDQEIQEEGAPMCENQIPPLNIHQLTSSTTNKHLSSYTSSSSLPTTVLSGSALSTVKISLLNRGTPNPRARIYRLPRADEDLLQKWASLAVPQPTLQRQAKDQKRQRKPHGSTHHVDETTRSEARQGLAASILTESDLLSRDDQQKHIPIPSEEDLIGFVTSGNFNLSEGKGTGIGSILLRKVLGDNSPTRGSNGTGSHNRRLCIVRNAGERVGRLGTWDVI